jgi:hypothetical protein
MHRAATRPRAWKKVAASATLGATLLLPACATPMVSVKCKGRPFRCTDEGMDVKFCESEVVAANGGDCAALGLEPSNHFCYVRPAYASCAHSHYVVQGRDCRISEYLDVRDGSECSAGTPTFVAP